MLLPHNYKIQKGSAYRLNDIRTLHKTSKQGVFVMKKYLLIPLLLLIVAFAFATEYMIGTGTSTQNYVPFDGLWDYSWSKTIYTKAELNAAGLNSEGNIDAISYYVGNTPSNYQMLDQRVYIRHTTLSTYGTATDETGTGYPNNTVFTYVFQGNLTLNGGGWFDIVFFHSFLLE